MRKLLAGICLGLAVVAASAQGDDAARADALYRAGKRLEALPLYGALTQKYPNEWIYAERLADCLIAKSRQTTNAEDIKALRMLARDSAARAVKLGDPNYYAKLIASSDPDSPVEDSLTGPAAPLIKDAEKAFTAGDFPTALAKYAQAADADPKLYEGPLYAGDTAYQLKDLKAAAKWFERAIAIDPNRETAYRYWGDALLKLGRDPAAAKAKFIDAVVAEPYNKQSWQGLEQWAHIEKATVQAPKIDRTGGSATHPQDPNQKNAPAGPGGAYDKNSPGVSPWLVYAGLRASYRNSFFKQDYPNEKEYRHTLKEESKALSLVALTMKNPKIKPADADGSLRNLEELKDAGMLDCWILISGADKGIAQDYDGYRKEHWQLLHDYVDRFVVHGGTKPAH